MDNASREDTFRDYYRGNRGLLFRSFEITIGHFHCRYDIYWGDPSVIFSTRALAEEFPLAVTTIPHIAHSPDPRIYLHEKLERKHTGVFELVIAHEIGHLWLHDVVGFNNPMTTSYMSESDSEVWADYFSYSYFVRYRGVSCLDDFSRIQGQASNLQMEVYGLDPKTHLEATFTRKVEKLKARIGEVDQGCREGNPLTIHMKNAVEITLDALGDIFR